MSEVRAAPLHLSHGCLKRDCFSCIREGGRRGNGFHPRGRFGGRGGGGRGGGFMSGRNGFGRSNGPDRLVEIGTGPVQGQGFNPQVIPGGFPGGAFPPAPMEGFGFPAGAQQPFFDERGLATNGMYRDGFQGGGTSGFSSPQGGQTFRGARNGRPFGGRNGRGQFTPKESNFRSQQERQGISDQVGVTPLIPTGLHRLCSHLHACIQSTVGRNLCAQHRRRAPDVLR